MVASFFPHLASALAEAVETTIECSVVKVKRQSLTAPRATEGPGDIADAQPPTQRGLDHGTGPCAPLRSPLRLAVVDSVSLWKRPWAWPILPEEEQAQIISGNAATVFAMV